MKYIKVKWIHNFTKEPILFYHEIDNYRNEIRRVEEFRDGHMNYLSDKLSKGTYPAEKRLPSLEEISNNPEFNLVEINKEDFEEIWEKANKQNH